MQIEGCKALYQCILAFDGKAIIPPNDGAGFDKSHDLVLGNGCFTFENTFRK